MILSFVASDTEFLASDTESKVACSHNSWIVPRTVMYSVTHSALRVLGWCTSLVTHSATYTV